MSQFKFYKEFVAKGRNKVDRPLANNTRAVDRGDRVAIKLHATDVVTFHENGDTEFNTGGWYTVTTKDRMDGYCRDFSIFSDKGTWYIFNRKAREAAEKRLRVKFGLPTILREYPVEHSWQDPHELVSLGSCKSRETEYGDWDFFGELVEIIGRKDAYRIYKAFREELKHAATYLFFDGIRFTARGRCVNGLTPEDSDKKSKAQEKLRLRIRDFAIFTATEVMDQGLPVQNNGDCWYCLFRTEDGGSLGDSHGDHEHLRHHLEEHYAPSALIVSAIRELGYSDPGVSIHLGVHEDDEGEIAMGGIRETQYGSRRRHDPDTVAKAVYQYIAKRILEGREVRWTRATFKDPVPVTA